MQLRHEASDGQAAIHYVLPATIAAAHPPGDRVGGWALSGVPLTNIRRGKPRARPAKPAALPRAALRDSAAV